MLGVATGPFLHVRSSACSSKPINFAWEKQVAGRTQISLISHAAHRCQYYLLGIFPRRTCGPRGEKRNGRKSPPAGTGTEISFPISLRASFHPDFMLHNRKPSRTSCIWDICCQQIWGECTILVGREAQSCELKQKSVFKTHFRCSHRYIRWVCRTTCSKCVIESSCGAGVEFIGDRFSATFAFLLRQKPHRQFAEEFGKKFGGQSSFLAA